ncbi:MAG: hypothetical protein ACK4WH_14125, partial [Phycisphaerales bacterium]
MSRYANNPVQSSLPYRIFFDPRAGMWTLATLFVCAVGYGVLRKASISSWAVVLLCLAGTLYERHWFDTHSALPVLTHVSWYGFWLTLGASVSGWLIAQEQRLASWELLAFGLISYGACTAVYLLDTATVNDLTGGSQVAAHAKLFVQAAFGAGGTLGIGALLGRIGRGPLVRLVEYTGRHSLEVYMVSSIGMVAARLALLKILGITNQWVLFITCFTAGLGLPLITVAVLDRLGIGYVFRFEPNTTRRLEARRSRVPLYESRFAG